jgi:hypothetical protein
MATTTEATTIRQLRSAYLVYCVTPMLLAALVVAM